MRAKRRRPLQTTDELKAAVGEWATKIKTSPRQIRIQRMAGKWASCSSNGRVTFNSDLFRQPYRFREFVIVHELLHLKIPNHGKLFRSLLKAYLPQWYDGRPLRTGRVASSRRSRGKNHK